MSTSTAEHDSYLVENWDTETLIDFLKEQNLKLEEKHFDILRNEEITGLSFLDMTEEKLRSYGFKGGPATLLAKEAKTLKEKPKRAFSTYRSLKEVLAKYNIGGNGIGTIRQFPPVSFKNHIASGFIRRHKVPLTPLNFLGDLQARRRRRRIGTMYKGNKAQAGKYGDYTC